MNILLNVPTHLNNGPYCAEYSLKGILEFLGINITIDKIVEEIKRDDGKLIFPIAIIPFLHHYSIPFLYPYNEKKVRETIEEGVEKKIVDFYGKEKENLINKINTQNLIKCMKDVLEQNLGTNQEIKVKDLEEAISNGKIPLLLVNITVLLKQPYELKGHYIYLRGFDADYFYYCDTGPITFGNDGKFKKDIFPHIQGLTWHDYSTIIIG